MSSAVATPRAKHSTPPLGTGDLHRALEASAKSAALEAFCRSTGTRPDEVSADGASLDILRVFDAMRARGYQVSEPERPQQQPKKGFTAWLVHVHKPGVEFRLGFYTAIEQPISKPLRRRTQA